MSCSESRLREEGLGTTSGGKFIGIRVRERRPASCRWFAAQLTAQSRRMSMFCKMPPVQKTVTWFGRDDARTKFQFDIYLESAVRWLSGRKRRFAKPLYGLKPVPRVRIPASPPTFARLNRERATVGKPANSLNPRRLSAEARSAKVDLSGCRTPPSLPVSTRQLRWVHVRRTPYRTVSGRPSSWHSTLGLRRCP